MSRSDQEVDFIVEKEYDRGYDEGWLEGYRDGVEAERQRWEDIMDQVKKDLNVE